MILIVTLMNSLDKESAVNQDVEFQKQIIQQKSDLKNPLESDVSNGFFV